MDLNINTSTVIDQLNKKNFLPGLYIVSTPIGNLADISVRALSLLSLSNLILCEDTRNSKKLTMKYGIKSTLKAFHKFNFHSLILFLLKNLYLHHLVNLKQVVRILFQALHLVYLFAVSIKHPDKI